MNSSFEANAKVIANCVRGRIALIPVTLGSVRLDR